VPTNDWEDRRYHSGENLARDYRLDDYKDFDPKLGCLLFLLAVGSALLLISAFGWIAVIAVAVAVIAVIGLRLRKRIRRRRAALRLAAYDELHAPRGRRRLTGGVRGWRSGRRTTADSWSQPEGDRPWETR